MEKNRFRIGDSRVGGVELYDEETKSSGMLPVSKGYIAIRVMSGEFENYKSGYTWLNKEHAENLCDAIKEWIAKQS